MRLHVQYVRPHLEFSTPAWAPWAEGDKNVLEKVQRKAVGMVSCLRSKVYEERLKELGQHADPGGEEAPGQHVHDAQNHSWPGRY